MNHFCNHYGRHRVGRARVTLVGGMVILSAAVSIYVLISLRHESPGIVDARSAFEQGDFKTALQLSKQLLERDPEFKDALLLAGSAALASGETRIAYDFYDRAVSDDGSEQSVEAMTRCGELAVKLCRLTKAEEYYRRVLRIQPNHSGANLALLNLLRIEGRNWEALPAIHQAFRQGKFVFQYLAMTGSPEAVWINAERDSQFLNYCAQVKPLDLLCLLGPNRLRIMEDSELDEARQDLRKIVAWKPDLVEAQAALGQLLLDSGAEQEFLTWHSLLPKSADQHPSIWVTRGRWARNNQQPRAAIRCLWEANRIFPNDRAANLMMANLLAEMGVSEQASLFQQRGERLLALNNLLMWGEMQEVDPVVRMTGIIEILEQLGRLWEARGWSQVLLSTDPNSSFAKAAIARLDQRLTPETPLTLASANLATAMDYSEFPLPVLPSTTAPKTRSQSSSVVSFEDVARSAQLDFTYFVDKQRFAKRVYTFDFAGGGIGVLDYDQDGWPDLYLTQSCSWPPTGERESRQNQLFRNEQGESFNNRTRLAGVGDTGFGNGVAVGDVNADGFPDLYVNNLGPNRLYLNNGDGTFSDRTQQSGTAGDDFSLSAVFVDLNRDGLPELYVVNYLGGDAMTRQCLSAGIPVQCSPHKFPGQQDRLYLNLGDGRFREVTEESGIIDIEGIGKGMDVLAANLDGVGGPDLFVTNDTTASFLFINKSELKSTAIQLQEQGTMSGVAFDDLGCMQSSMGIAGQDINRDGLIDLFVTNFIKERNNLYVQKTRQPSLLFSDLAMASKLAEPSYLTMGWGAQFLDAELDGDWDVAVANGFLGEISIGTADGTMRPQFFENEGDAKFRELPGFQLGSYWARTYFGRAMARLDWNRDGLEDLCVTHMEDPVALLQNTSRRQGRFVVLQLRGVDSSRDAIGATLQITAGGTHWTVHHTAGGGFEAASQQQLVVGLGHCDEIDQLTVRWPDEQVQIYRKVPVDCELLLIQGRTTPVILRVRTDI